MLNWYKRSPPPIELERKNYTILKAIVIGDSGTGKSSISERFANNYYTDDTTMTIGVEFYSKTISVQQKTIKIQLWDTSGQEIFNSITRQYYRGADLILIAYDVTNRETLNNIEKWWEDVSKTTCDCIICLVGTKIDARKNGVAFNHVSFEEGETLANRFDSMFMETSSKDRINIDDVFHIMTREYIERFGIKSTESKTIILDQPIKPGYCCNN